MEANVCCGVWECCAEDKVITFNEWWETEGCRIAMIRFSSAQLILVKDSFRTVWDVAFSEGYDNCTNKLDGIANLFEQLAKR